MEKGKELYENRIKKLEQIITNTNNILGSLMEYQISLESHLQDLIKSQRSHTIAIKGSSKIDFIPVHEIIYCNANLSYTEIISTNNNKVIATKSLNEFEEHLFDYNFFRISKSALINTEHIHSYNRKSGQILMKNQDLLEVARRRKAEFLTNIIAL